MTDSARVSLVTGAGSGFGRATAVAMAARGDRVVVADLNDAAGLETVELIRSGGGEAGFVGADVSSAAGAGAAVDAASSRFGGLDVLVNNAGIRQDGPESAARPNTWNCDEDIWDRVLTVNLKSIYLCSRAAIPIMIGRGGGAIVNVASIAVHVSVGGAAYAAAKGGIASYTRHVANELGDRNIRVNCVSPGFMRTPMTTRLEAGTPAEQQAWADAWVESRRPLVPLGRVGEVEDIAGAICYLSGDSATFVTGQEIVVDGGFLTRGV
jgi:NAD(P)-dependent dehydrogenase (short-subunit alcohol dehydrogenase family)